MVRKKKERTDMYLTDRRILPSVPETRKQLDKARKAEQARPADLRRTSTRS